MGDATGTRGRDLGMLRRMTWAPALGEGLGGVHPGGSARGEGLDGFALGVIAVVLPLISKELGLSPVWSGLIAASTLVGIFFGSPVVGWLSDRIGRGALLIIELGSLLG